MRTVVFDLDGTLANLEHRLYYAKTKQWDEFFKHVKDDTPIQNNCDLFRLLSMMKGANGFPYIEVGIVSGRSDSCKADTIRWLNDNQLHFSFLHMREDGDHRPDYITKHEIYKKYLQNRDILCIFDDRKQVVNLWRSLGLTCHQVADGNF
ncbi:MAG: phosphatase domain-containing protein [Nitrosotalea sp.]